MGQPPRKAEGGKQKGLLADRQTDRQNTCPGTALEMRDVIDDGAAVSAQRDKCHCGHGDPGWEPLWALVASLGTWAGTGDTGRGRQPGLSPPSALTPTRGSLDGKEVSRSREAGGLGTAHLILVSQDYK